MGNFITIVRYGNSAAPTIPVSDLGVLVASFYSKKRQSCESFSKRCIPTFADFEGGVVPFPSVVEDFGVKEVLLGAMTGMTRARMKQFLMKSIPCALILIACVGIYTHSDEVLDLVCVLREGVGGNSAASLRESPWDSLHPEFKGNDFDPVKMCRFGGNIFFIGGCFISFVGLWLWRFLCNFLAKRTIKGIIDNINNEIQDQGIVLEWIEDYNPLPCCHCKTRYRRTLTGFNLRLDVSKWQLYCEANGKPFDAEVYNATMNPGEEIPFDRDSDVYIGARCPDTMPSHAATVVQENTYPLVEPPPYSDIDDKPKSTTAEMC